MKKAGFCSQIRNIPVFFAVCTDGLKGILWPFASFSRREGKYDSVVTEPYSSSKDDLHLGQDLANVTRSKIPHCSIEVEGRMDKKHRRIS